MMNRFRFLFLVSGIFMLALTGYAQTSTMSLNSSNPQILWKIRPQADMKNATGEQISTPEFEMSGYVKGVVPAPVFTSYVEAGLVPDPNYADNIYQVDETYYNRPFWYRTEFELPASYKEGKRVWLHFDNTNRFADFYFNGKKISGTPGSTKDVSGHMLRSKFDVTDLINKSSKNAVAVLITDPDQKKTRKAKDPYGVACSPSYLAGAGWDWMPYVPGRLAGITGNAYLAITGDVIMEDPWVRSDLPTLQQAELSISTDIRNASSSPQEVVLSGVIRPGNIKFSKTIRIEGNETGRLSVDKNDFKRLVINNPKLWWPNGYGAPNLYTCKLTCSVNGKVSDEKEVTFGIKKYEYKMVNNSVNFPVLTFFVNGQKVFLKGGNWGMSEYLLRCQGKEYETKIRLHKEMNYNMIRLWTGCVTDDDFYDYCDKYGIMVWNDFWLYVAYNDVAQPEAFKANALDKVRRLRNHPSIAIWCGANETHPKPELDNYLREMIAKEDNNDRMYKSCSNQDGLSGSGWWGNQPPRHHFETSASNLAFNKPAYPYGIDHGYGMRTEIGTATFPTFESVKLFIPQRDWWPLPTDEQLKNDDDNVWNKHFFGKEASNANPINYKKSVNIQYGESSSLEEFCEKAQLLNIEVMKGMYEAWNDKMWNDAAGLLIWMSHPAYPSFVWQTYDYYYDPTGAYWGAKKACEHLHIQWNASNNSIKAVNTTSKDLKGATVKATIYDLNGKELPAYGQSKQIDVPASNIAEAFTLNFSASKELTPLHFIKLELTDAKGNLLSENFYWRNGVKELDYTLLNTLPEADLSCKLADRSRLREGKMKLLLKNNSGTVAFANRLRLVNKATGARILPVIMSDNYITLLPHEEKVISVEAEPELLRGGVNVLLKQYRKPEEKMLDVEYASWQSGAERYAANPIIKEGYADPEAIIYDDKYWIYPTSSNGAQKATYFDCFSSTNLVDWEKHNCILDTATISWAWKALWAPSVLRKDNKYYLFFSANDIHQGQVGGIGVAVSDRPEGPYQDLLGKPLISDIVNGAQPIDQFVFHDNGNYYMYYGGWGHCNIVRLSDDFTRLIPFDDGQMYKEITPEKYVEGPFVFKKNGKYYFMWSEGAWTGPDYCVAYAIADSPFGPFKRIGKILQQDAAIGTGAGHHSVIHIPDSDEYYIVYHRHPLGSIRGTQRHVCIDRMTFDKNGYINPVRITNEGVKARPLSKVK